MAAPTGSQRYLSTRGGSFELSFEEVVLKGLASDGGLFIPEEIPKLPEDWSVRWKGLPFADLAFEILSLYISSTEIPSKDLKDILRHSYSTFRHPDITPLKTLDSTQNLHLLELFHGPTFAFKDVALQFLGNLFEYFLVRKNQGKTGSERQHLTVVGATSGDTGSAAIYGLRGKKDVSLFIMFPQGRVSPIQEAQMTTVLDPNVHNLAVEGTFDDCQDMVKALFADEELAKTHSLAAINSINWARILAQITYYFHAYFSVTGLESWTPGAEVRVAVPSGNFGDVLAGFFAKRMGLPIAKLIVATNENDILDRFFRSGRYEKLSLKKPSDASIGLQTDGAKAHSSGVLETLSPAMDILVSSNFERLLYILQLEQNSPSSNAHTKTSEQVASWLYHLKSDGGFSVSATLHAAAACEFDSERISDPQTLAVIRTFFSPPIPTTISSVLDPHSAIGVAASLRSMAKYGPPETHTIALATAHPAKFSAAVKMALDGAEDFDFDVSVLPKEFVGMEERERRVRSVGREIGVPGMRDIIRELVEAEVK